MKILKFGGKSLAHGVQHVIDIIKQKHNEGPITVVVSAIGDTTDTLEHILDIAVKQENYENQLYKFMEREVHNGLNCEKEFHCLKNLYAGVQLLADYNAKIKDQVLAQGEIIASKYLAHLLHENGLAAQAIDSRTILEANHEYGNGIVRHEISAAKVQARFRELKKGVIPIVTGFIARTPDGNTITLGRNGSNYTAALLANFLHADELQNYTHVNGIFTANPDWVKEARKIEHLHFDDANELASFGTSILHAKTILPLLKNQTPLRILNTLQPDNSGTLISSTQTAQGIKSLSVQSDVALIAMNGRGLLGKIGVDARIFSAMERKGISVGVISQGSSERGIGFIIDERDADNAVEALRVEFKSDILLQDVSKIEVRKNLSVLSIVGQELKDFDKTYSALVKKNIIPILFNNAVTGRNVSLILDSHITKKAVNVIHQHLFSTSREINLAILGHGLVGSTLINQILDSADAIEDQEGIKLNIFAIGNSRNAVFDVNGIKRDWELRMHNEAVSYEINDLIHYAVENNLGNLIAIDNTASLEPINSYNKLVENGFDLISSNKFANTLSYDFYKNFRSNLHKHQKHYLYETNVGAGLPLISTLKSLQSSGDKIKRIRGVFSGSLSFIFNSFSADNIAFSTVIKQAVEQGFTEPDPREDLSGADVGRKLLIVARELGFSNEYEDIVIENLIPPELQKADLSTFFSEIDKLDPIYAEHKNKLKKNHVLSYIGELSGDLLKGNIELKAGLCAEPVDSAIGSLRGSENLFEIYTSDYGEKPIIIQGAGAGAAVTARGVLMDLLSLARTHC